MGFVPVPLHQIHVKSGIVTGFFTVGVCSCFPVNGIDLIMGNDIAGCRVDPVPEVVKAQRSDSSLTKCLTVAVSKSEFDQKQSFFEENGVLMRRWNSQSEYVATELGEDWGVVYQVVIPVNCRQQLLSLAYEHIRSGHLGITETYNRVL